MNTQLSTFFKPAALMFTIAIAIPSSAIAFDSNDVPDRIVTMTVDLPATDGSGGGGGVCSGYSSIDTSASNLAATLDEINPGISNPTLEQRVQLYGFELDQTFEDADSNPLIFTEVEGGGRLEFNTIWADANPEMVSLLDTNTDGFIDDEDFSPLMLDRRVFVSDDFTVSFEASTCVASSKFGIVWAERSPVQTYLQDPQGGAMYWETAEIDFFDLAPIFPNDPLRAAVTATNNASAYLLRPTRIADGLINVPLQLANYVDGNNIPVVAGDEGSASLRGVMQLYGDQTQGQYRVMYGFWLYVDTFDNFLDEADNLLGFFLAGPGDGSLGP